MKLNINTELSKKLKKRWKPSNHMQIFSQLKLNKKHDHKSELDYTFSEKKIQVLIELIVL